MFLDLYKNWVVQECTDTTIGGVKRDIPIGSPTV